ncbi:MAG TPA: potassium transporter TrkG [Bacteroidia bacterium]|nr:potassium transporter TrkG [Bacteroidia bacterium]
MSINEFREKVNLRLFKSKDTVLFIFGVLSSLIAVLAVGLLIYSIGFPQTPALRNVEMFFIKTLFGFYILNFIVRFLYTFEPLLFLKSNTLELGLVLLLTIEAFSSLLFNKPVFQTLLEVSGYGAYIGTYIVTLQMLLLILLVIDIAKATTFMNFVKLKPSSMFILSFLLLISIGAVMLMLPEMTTDKQGADAMTAIFTSTSASCVTGLIVVDTATFFTLKGKLVIMFLIQLGGLNIISFATFFASFFSKGVGLKHHSLMQDFFSSGSLLDAKSLLRQIIFMSITIEVMGAIAIYSLLDPSLPFHSVKEKVFFSVFHSISAFNNAGFSLYTNGLFEPVIKGNYILHIAFAGLIFFGSLGFSTIRDVFSLSAMRERMRLPWKQFQLSTQISLFSSIVLVVFGAVAFYLLANHNVLEGKKPFESTVISIFQSVTCRTAGFNTIDIGSLTTPTLILMILLMFIGASSGSTGGGIKTSTFTIIILSAFSTIRGKRNLELLRHNIAWELLNKAFSIFIFSASFIFVCTFILSMQEPGIDMMKLLFEEVSAFGTVGLSTGITSALTDPAKTTIIISMFVGRIGTLTIALALSSQVANVDYKYPNAHFMVG